MDTTEHFESFDQSLKYLSAQEFLERAPASLWPLTPLTGDGASIEVVKRVGSAIEARTDLDTTRRADHLAVLWFMAEAENVPVEVLKVWLTEEKLMASVLYQEILEKGIAQGIARGEARGKAQGIVRGEARGKAQGIVRGEAREKHAAKRKASLAVKLGRRRGPSPESLCTALDCWIQASGRGCMAPQIPSSSSFGTATPCGLSLPRMHNGWWTGSGRCHCLQTGTAKDLVSVGSPPAYREGGLTIFG